MLLQEALLFSTPTHAPESGLVGIPRSATEDLIGRIATYDLHIRAIEELCMMPISR